MKLNCYCNQNEKQKELFTQSHELKHQSRLDCCHSSVFTNDISKSLRQKKLKYFWRHAQSWDKKSRNCSRSMMKPAEPLGNIALLPLVLLSCQETVKTTSFQQFKNGHVVAMEWVCCEIISTGDRKNLVPIAQHDW